MTAPDRVRIGISACLLGERVRYDGGHKRDRFAVRDLAGRVDLVPVCPEVEAGLSIPREPIRLEDGGRRVIGVGSRIDYTAILVPFARARVRALLADDLDGYLFKKGSPSCGPRRVKVWGGGSHPVSNGVGVFAAELRRFRPFLPIDDEDHLADPGAREAFVAAVFAHRRWRRLGSTRLSALREFHERHRARLRAHDPHGESTLTRWLGDDSPARGSGTARPRRHPAPVYAERVFAILARSATLSKHHAALGWAARRLAPDPRGGLRRTLDHDLDRLAEGELSLNRIHDRFRSVAEGEGAPWGRTQTYLVPDPDEAALLRSVRRGMS